MADPSHIGQLTPDPQNRRRRTERNLGMIADALHEVGAARSIVIDEHDTILAGNGVWEAAGQVGIERLRVVEAEGDELIAVRRRGLTDAQKRRLALYDNRAAELAEWDVGQLLRDVESGLNFEGLFNPDELAGLLAQVNGAAVPDFQPATEEEQGRLDQKAPVTCPSCGHEFSPA